MRLFRKITRDKKKIRRIQTFLAILFAALSVIAITLINANPESLSTEKADALYGGRTEVRMYSSAGYVTDYSSVFTRQVCGIAYLSENTALTAAHCFDEKGLYYAGSGVYKSDPPSNVPISNFFYHPDWDKRSLAGDIVFVTLEHPVVEQINFAEISKPEIGCGYEVLAYGSTDIKILSNYDLRRKAPICIEAVTQDKFYFTSPEAGVCFGDSGSPVFVKDTNKLVGIVSAITVDKNPYSKDNCFINNRAIATRADSALELLSVEVDKKDDNCPAGSGIICRTNETCRSNRCMKMDDFVYISALDYRSSNYAFASLSSSALVIIFALSSVGFLLIGLSRLKRVV